MKRIAVFGTGKVGKIILSLPLRKNYSIAFVCDNDSNKWGTSICGYKILSPAELLKTEVDYVCLAIVTRGMWQNVYKQLLAYGITDEKIIYSFDYVKINYCRSPLDEFFDIEKKQFHL